jgi:ribonuclease HI
MSHADPSTTNNLAEYSGLVTGLRAAKEYRWSPLEVIEDSQLIINQMKGYRPPQEEQSSEALRHRETDSRHAWRPTLASSPTRSQRHGRRGSKPSNGPSC